MINVTTPQSLFPIPNNLIKTSSYFLQSSWKKFCSKNYFRNCFRCIWNGSFLHFNDLFVLSPKHQKNLQGSNFAFINIATAEKYIKNKSFLKQKSFISKSLNLPRIFQLRKKRGKFKLMYLDLSLFMQHNKYGNKIELKKIGEVRQSLNNVILCRLKNERHKLTEWCRGN